MRCHKVIFTKRQAKAALKENKKNPNQYRKEKRYYYCRECNGWHLTSEVRGGQSVPLVALGEKIKSIMGE